MKNTYLNISIIVLFLLILSGCNNNEKNIVAKTVNSQYKEYTTWSIKMADSEIERRGTSMMFGGSDPKAKWRYTTGLFCKALFDLWNATGDQKYYDYAKKVIDSFIDDSGEIYTYNIEDYNLDKLNSGKVLLDLFQITNQQKYKKSATLLREQLQNQPRTSEGGFWHKKRYPWQMWLDGIYMSAPFYAEYALLFGEKDTYDDVLKQIKIIDVHTRDNETGLRYHGWDESNEQAWADPVTGCSPHFWGRGLGWYSMALVDVLDYIPADHKSRKEIRYILNDLLISIIKYQDKTGLWYQVINLGARSGNYLETSCSAMFIYSISKAINKGYINGSFKEVAVKGFNGLINKMIIVDEKNMMTLNGICSVAGLGGDPYRDGSFEYYISEPVVSNDLKGVGPFIMAGIQLDKIK